MRCGKIEAMRDHGTPSNQYVADEGLILLAEVGSTVHGVTVQGSDDLDLQGVCIESPGILVGHHNFEQYIARTHADGSRIPNHERSYAGDTDKVVYSLRKWTSLAVKGNPTVLLPLFVPESKLHYVNDFGYQLRDSREMFLSKQALYAFRGYLTTQRMNAFQSTKHTNRPELVERFGFDTKSAYHALRIAVQGAELMQDHRINVPMTEPWIAYLRKVRNGEVPLYEVLGLLDGLIVNLETSAQNSTLPDTVDLDVVDVWLTGMYKTFWKVKSWV